MPTTAQRPTIAMYGFANPVPANISQVNITAGDGHASVRMPSRNATLRIIQMANGNIFSDGSAWVESVQVDIDIENREPVTVSLNAKVSRIRQGRRINFVATSVDESPEINLATRLYTAALNNESDYDGPLGVHLGVTATASLTSLGIVEDFAMFQSIYDSVETYNFEDSRYPTIAEGFNVPTVSAQGARTFGIEIEVDFPESTNYGYERNMLARRLYDAGLSQNSDPQRWHHAARAMNADGSSGYTTAMDAWSVEFDRSVDTVDGMRGCEIVSPILTDTVETWDNIATILSIVKELGGQVTTRTGLHVNVGTSDMRQTSVISMLRTASQFDDLMIRLAHTPEVGPQHRGRGFCQYVWVPQDVSDDYYLASNLVSNNGHMSAINLSHMERPVHNRASTSARAEFRYFDGTLQVGRIQTYVMLCMAMVNVATAGIENLDLPAEMSGAHLDRRGGRARTLQGEAWRESTVRVRQFIDYLRLGEEAAKVVTAAYRQSRWMGQR